jgi:hypothetical protein
MRVILDVEGISCILEDLHDLLGTAAVSDGGSGQIFKG